MFELTTAHVACMQRDEAGRSKGWGIVEFETPEEVRSRLCINCKQKTHNISALTPLL